MTSETELAWAAGFFDGEGCVYARKVADRSWRRPGITIVQADVRSLERFCDAVGLDRRYLIGPKPQPGAGNKPIYEIRVNKLSVVVSILEAIGPYLSGPKTEQAAQVMAKHEEGLRVAAAWRLGRPNNARGGRFGAPRGENGRFLPAVKSA